MNIKILFLFLAILLTMHGGVTLELKQTNLSEDELIKKIIELDTNFGASALDLVFAEKLSKGACMLEVPKDVNIYKSLPDFDVRGTDVALYTEPIKNAKNVLTDTGIPSTIIPGERVKVLCQKGAYILIYVVNNRNRVRDRMGWVRFGTVYTADEAVYRGLNPEDIIWQSDKIQFRDKVVRAVNLVYKNNKACRDYIDPRKVYDVTSVNRNYILYSVHCGVGNDAVKVLFKLDGTIVEIRNPNEIQ